MSYNIRHNLNSLNIDNMNSEIVHKCAWYFLTEYEDGVIVH
jgi:hypothetical protein